MAIISSSDKLGPHRGHSKITAENYVLLRIVKEEDKTYKVMTATAGEDDNSSTAYPQQAQLMEAAENQFCPISQAWEKDKRDRENRAYVEFYRIDDPCDIQEAANRLTTSLGLDPATCAWIDAVARQEMKDIWHEFAVDDDETAYMSDGMSMTRNRKIIDEKP